MMDSEKILEQEITDRRALTNVKGWAKGQALCELLERVNKICEQGSLEYFAIGELLTWCHVGYDSYPDNTLYSIGMPRKDYEEFMHKIDSYSTMDGLTMETMYEPNCEIRFVHTRLIFEKVVCCGEDRMKINLSLRIEPYDCVPGTLTERRIFQNRLSETAREYRIKSRSYRKNIKKADGEKNIFRNIARRYHNYQAISELKILNKKYKNMLNQFVSDETCSDMARVELLHYPSHKKEDIFPIHKKRFLSVELMVPAAEAGFMPLPPAMEEEKLLKKRRNVLQDFDTFCGRHGISYVALGSLAMVCDAEQLRSIIQKDWHVGLLRKDYERLLSLLREQEGEGSLALMEDIEEYPAIFNITRKIATGYDRKRYPGDKIYGLILLPLDTVPKNYEKYIELAQKIQNSYDAYQKVVEYEKGLRDVVPGWKDSLEAVERFHGVLQSGGQDGEHAEGLYAYIDHKLESYDYDRLFPEKRRKIGISSISVPKECCYWNAENDEAYWKGLFDQKTKILERFDAFCHENGFVYFAIAKLLIGAVVYNDVIPGSKNDVWDLGLLRADYDACVKVLKNQGEKAGLRYEGSFDGEEKYPYPTVLVRGNDCIYENAYIRLLPFDKLPENFYLCQGFVHDMEEKNQEYQLLLKEYKVDSILQKKKEKKKTILQHFEGKTPKEAAQMIEQCAQLFQKEAEGDLYMRIAFAKSKRISEEELFPLQRVAFRGIEIDCPKDTSIWQPYQDEELDRQIKEIQKANISLLKEFARVCKRLNIGYFVCGGTMLGCMRHGGFIPWDDDIDVAMLREDYDRFLIEAKPILDEQYFLQTRETDPNIPYLYSKLRLNDTEYITPYAEHRQFHNGIGIDIFPFDYLPNDLKERKAFVAEIQAQVDRHYTQARERYKVLEGEWPEARTETEAEYLKKEKALIERAWQTDLAKSQAEYLKVATRYNKLAKKETLTTVGSFVPSYTWIDVIDLLPYGRRTFEGMEVSVPKRPDVFLTMQYKNYMELPPKHMQVGHKVVRWSTGNASGGKDKKGRDRE